MTTSCRVVVVDASPFVCRLVTSFVQSAPRLACVIGSASTRLSPWPSSANSPDVHLDLQMRSQRLEATDHARRATSVILVTGVSRDAAEITKEALPLGGRFPLKVCARRRHDPEILRQELVSKIRSAVDRRNGVPAAPRCRAAKLAPGKILGRRRAWSSSAPDRRAVASSRTLGVAARGVSHAIVVVQHMPPHHSEYSPNNSTNRLACAVRGGG